VEKAHPAPFAAAEVRSVGKEAAGVRRELKRAEWVLRLYEWHFPWLTELRDLEEERSFVVVGGGDAAIGESDDGQPPDPAQHWLSEEEFRALPEVERNQRALDRYLRSPKAPWQLGRDYERYIGYLRERDGARVTYQGIFAGLEDLGRDLLAERDGLLEVIQCKRWAKHKTIHEKHVFQLFGTVVAARIEYPDRNVTGTFVTTTMLSERAHEFARQLDVKVEEGIPLGDYPRIKCNVGPGGERIYHLPFDQQYDTTVITPERGETWVATAAEAEALGFLRAWRWREAEASSSSARG
jgi:Restriction endonuclease